MNEKRNLLVVIQGDTKDFEKSMQSAHGASDKLNAVLGKAFKLAAGAAVAGFGAMTAIAVSSVNAFKESEEATAQLNAVLKSTNNIAGVTAKEVQTLSTKLQNVTKFSDETITSAQSLLLTFTKIGKDVFPDATKTVLDMSQALGQDTKSSAIQLGKALNDPIRGITALRKVGVSFTEQQEQQIKKMVESGKVMEAQKLILQELQTEFGGSAEAAGNTFGGKIEILKNKIGDLQETMGSAIITAITPFIERLSAWADSPEAQQFVQNLTDKITFFITDTAPKVVDAIQQIIDKTRDIIAWYNTHKDTINSFVIPAVAGLTGAILALKTAMFIGQASQAFQAAMLVMQASAAATSFKIVGVGGLAPALASLPMLVTIGVALAGFAAVMQEIKKLNQALDELDKSSENLYETNLKAINKVKELRAAGRNEEAARLMQTITRNAPEGRAIGGPVAAGTPYIVGEEGPELIIPKTSGTVIPNDKLQFGNQPSVQQVFSPRIQFNVGMYAGMPHEKREIAADLWRELVRIARSNGVQLPQIGVTPQ